MTTLLVLTVGQSDVQLVIDGVRHELEPKQCGMLHDEIERRGYRLVETPDAKDRERKGVLPEGDLTLCTPKLDAVLAELVPTTALVLETRRDAASAPGDPRLSGSVLESRLLMRGVTTVQRVEYLTGKERLEDRSAPRDSVIRREVVCRLEEAVRSTVESANPSRIVLATTGGFPVVSSLVEEIVRLHALVDVVCIEVADGANADPLTADRAVARTSVPEPLTSFQARRRALELVGRGNLLGAWAVAEPLHNDEIERGWTQTIEWLARFASSLPMPGDCDISVLKHPRMAVRAALRVELALRAGDIPRAVHGTVAFFEAALWDKVLEHFERDPQDVRRLKLKAGALSPDGKLLRDGGDDDRNRPFDCQQPPGAEPWFRFHESGAGRFARDYVKSQTLKSLLDAVDKVRVLRNDVAHNEPTPELMDAARHRMRNAELWSTNDTFLSQPLVKDVLRALGEAHPETLCEDMIATVRSRLVNP